MYNNLMHALNLHLWMIRNICIRVKSDLELLRLPPVYSSKYTVQVPEIAYKTKFIWDSFDKIIKPRWKGR